MNYIKFIAFRLGYNTKEHLINEIKDFHGLRIKHIKLEKRVRNFLNKPLKF